MSTTPPTPTQGAPDEGLTYVGWGYEPGQYGGTVSVFEAGARLLGVVNARYEADEDGHCIEWDRTGWLPVGTVIGWRPPRDLVLTPLGDDEQDDHYDELRDALREVLRD
jgi:hypothetical protein